jgi:hypothetical protein
MNVYVDKPLYQRLLALLKETVRHKQSDEVVTIEFDKPDAARVLDYLESKLKMATAAKGPLTKFSSELKNLINTDRLSASQRVLVFLNGLVKNGQYTASVLYLTLIIQKLDSIEPLPREQLAPPPDESTPLEEERIKAMNAKVDQMHQEFLATKEGSVVNAAKVALDNWSNKNRGSGGVLTITFPNGISTHDKFDEIFKEQIAKYTINDHDPSELNFFFEPFKRSGRKPGEISVNNSDNFDGRANRYLEKLLYAMEHTKGGSGKKTRRRRSKRYTRRR